MILNLWPALRTYLLADAAIFAAVDGSADLPRIFPAVLPQGIRAPSIVYNRISGLGDHHMQGPSGLTRPRYQIDTWAETPDAAAALSDLVKARLDGFRGTMSAGGSPDVVIQVQGVFADQEEDRYDGEADLYGVRRDFLIWWVDRVN